VLGCRQLDVFCRHHLIFLRLVPSSVVACLPKTKKGGKKTFSAKKNGQAVGWQQKTVWPT
jgi:hypothetical protein